MDSTGTTSTTEETRPLTDEEIREIVKDSFWCSDEYICSMDSIIAFENTGKFRISSGISPFNRIKGQPGGPMDFGSYIVQNNKIVCTMENRPDSRFSFEIERINTSPVYEYVITSSALLSKDQTTMRFYRTAPGVSSEQIRTHEGFTLTTVTADSYSVWGTPTAYKTPDFDSEQRQLDKTIRSGTIIGRIMLQAQTWYLWKVEEYIDGSAGWEYTYSLVWIPASAVYPSMIDNYYRYITQNNLSEAYEIWHKKSSYEDFVKMYSDVASARILDIKYEGETTWRLLVQVFFDDGTQKKYRVTMTVDDTHIVDSKSVEVP